MERHEVLGGVKWHKNAKCLDLQVTRGQDAAQGAPSPGELCPSGGEPRAAGGRGFMRAEACEEHRQFTIYRNINVEHVAVFH